MTLRLRSALLLWAALIAPALGGPVDTSAGPGKPPAPSTWSAQESALIETIEAYHAALTGADVGAIESLVMTDDQFVMLEGRHSNWGWHDYRDHHLAGELEDLSKVRFRLSFYRVRVDAELGYATFRYEVLPREGPEMDFGKGFATAVLERTGDQWKIRHLHTS
ncbi:MAG: YybH family protein [Gammaproteobacteria bacterium]